MNDYTDYLEQADPEEPTQLDFGFVYPGDPYYEISGYTIADDPEYTHEFIRFYFQDERHTWEN